MWFPENSSNLMGLAKLFAQVLKMLTLFQYMDMSLLMMKCWTDLIKCFVPCLNWHLGLFICHQDNSIKIYKSTSTWYRCSGTTHVPLRTVGRLLCHCVSLPSKSDNATLLIAQSFPSSDSRSLTSAPSPPKRPCLEPRYRNEEHMNGGLGENAWLKKNWLI